MKWFNLFRKDTSVNTTPAADPLEQALLTSLQNDNWTFTPTSASSPKYGITIQVSGGSAFYGKLILPDSVFSRIRDKIDAHLIEQSKRQQAAARQDLLTRFNLNKPTTHDTDS